MKPKISFRSNWTIGHGNSERTESKRQQEAISSDIWYYADESGHVGPFGLEQLTQTLSSMADPAHLLVWCNKFSEWQRVRDVPEVWKKIMVMPTAHTVQDARNEDLFWRKLISRLLMFTIALLGSANNRFGREEMRRISNDRPITTQAKRWLREGAPDKINDISRIIKANLLVVLIAVACVAYGTYDGLLLNSPLSGLFAGLLSSVLVSLAILTARRYRINKPGRILVWIGNLAYWIGWALASYGIFLILYQISHAGLGVGFKAIANLLPSVIFYILLGWSIRYMLGR